MAQNSCHLSFEIIGCEGLRYTPAGVPVVRGVGRHRSQHVTTQGVRQVDFQFQWIATGPLAESLSRLPLGSCLCGQGYLAASRRGGRALHLCLESVEPDSETERTG